MKTCDYVASFLREKKVTHVFELVGGMITFLIDAMHQAGGIRIVSVHHEQAAGFAAEGWARVTGIPGVALATSGPGATNLLTAIGSCHFDSVPAVFITGQVNTHEMKRDRAIRQLGFQETDIVAMARPITKAAWQASSAAEVPALLERAFALALEGRPGPVLLDLPMDVQRQEIPGDAVVPAAPAAPPASRPVNEAAEILEGLARTERPLILAGGGLRASGCAASFRRFVEKAGVPVVHSLMGVDLLPFSDPRRVGMIGSYGNRYANHALSDSDFLLVLGSRLDVRQTGADTAGFKGRRSIYHVDCEAGEINNRVQGCVAVLSPLSRFLDAALALPFPASKGHAAWIGEIARLRAQWPDEKEYLGGGINPNLFLQQLSQCGEAAAYVADVGQHQMWAAQSLRLGPDQRFLTSGGMGSMGFSLPAAIGACFGSGERPVTVIAGDGGFQCNLQELQTVARNGLPLKMVILNNRCHGMVRQFQETYFAERYQSTLWGYDAPSFAAVATAYKIASRELMEASDTAAALAWLWSDPKAPALLEVFIEPMGNVYPKMAFGRPLHEMEPLVQPTAMEST